MSGPLTSRDPEPGLGAKVQDDLGRIWINTGGERTGASNWELDDTVPGPHDVESWNKVAGNYGPVREVTLP